MVGDAPNVNGMVDKVKFLKSELDITLENDECTEAQLDKFANLLLDFKHLFIR